MQDEIDAVLRLKSKGHAILTIEDEVRGIPLDGFAQAGIGLEDRGSDSQHIGFASVGEVIEIRVNLHVRHGTETPHTLGTQRGLELTELPSRQRTWTVAQSTPPVTDPTYLIDGNCGFCRQAMARVHKAFPGTFTSMPYADADLAGLGLTTADCTAHGHFLKPTSGEVIISSGSQSWAFVLLEQSLPWRVVGHLMRTRPFKWIADATYTLVANNRHRLHSANG